MKHDPAKPALFVFGSQLLSFDQSSASQLKTAIDESFSFSWVGDVLSELSTLWPSLEKRMPHLRPLDGQQLLRALETWLETGKLDSQAWPLKNILLTPLVVLSHLVEYTSLFEHDGSAPGPPSHTASKSLLQQGTQTLGLCTGLLSASVASFSSSLQDLQTFGAVALRLAVLIGATVDSEDLQHKGGHCAESFSIYSTQFDQESLKSQLQKFNGAYIAVRQDMWRCTITAPASHGSNLKTILQRDGYSTTDMPLHGQFHSAVHEESLLSLLQFCDDHASFRFPGILAPSLSFRSNVSGQLIESGRLHAEILESILTVQSNWSKAFKVAEADFLLKTDAQVFAFGAQNCLPASWARRLVNHNGQPQSCNRLAPGGKRLDTKGISRDLEKYSDECVAIIGMACHLPGADDLIDYWSILEKGSSQHVPLPKERFKFETPWRKQNPKTIYYGNFINHYDTFDHKFFNKSAREMSSTDPQHRLMLQVAYQAIEQSGYFNRPDEDIDKHIGCYIGVGLNDYERNIACSPATAYSATGNLKSFTAGKISHQFGWTGPGLIIDTACSSSAVAIHNACRAILTGECTGGALAGGVNIMTSTEWFENLAGASFLSPTGQCKPFDAKADGYCRGEGVGAVFLKKLSSAVADGDHVLGVIGSSLVYQNENCTPLTVPNSVSLQSLFTDAIRRAHMDPSEVTYVEAHGTGTAVGDPAEYDSIRNVFGGISRKIQLSLGSVKGLLGHTEFASGITALLKVLLMVNIGKIPPQASFETLNPATGATEQDMIEIAKSTKIWSAKRKVALINNYGASGSNACLVVTQGQGPSQTPRPDKHSSFSESLPFWFCAADESSLRAYAQKLLHALQVFPEMTIQSLSYMAGRQSNRRLPLSLRFSCFSKMDLQKTLQLFVAEDSSTILWRKKAAQRPVILCFGGQSAKYIGLDRSLYDRVTVLRRHIDDCDKACRAMGLDTFFPSIFEKEAISDIVKLQTMLFAVQYSFAKTWMDCGLKVTSMVGFSFGELVALAISQDWCVEDAISMIAGRSRAIRDHWGPDAGAMMAVDGNKAIVDELLRTTSDLQISVACYTGQTSVTLSGPTSSIDTLYRYAINDTRFSTLKCKRIDVTHSFHSSLVDPVLSEVQNLVGDIQFREPSISLEHSTRDHLDSEKLTSSFFAEHLRQPVFFKHAIERLVQKFGDCIWVEAGFNSGITSVASRVIGSSSESHMFQPLNIGNTNGLQAVSDMTIALWKQDLNFSFWLHHKSQQHDYCFLPLPPYQFEKSRHWKDITLPTSKIDSAEELGELNAGMWSRIDDETDSRRSFCFKINTQNGAFQELVHGHVIAQSGPLCPTTLQLSIVVEALRSLPSSTGLAPILRNTVLQAPMPLGTGAYTVVQVEASDKDLKEWTWKILSYTSSRRDSTAVCHISGDVVFSVPTDRRYQDEFVRFNRLVSAERYRKVLYDSDPDEISKGPSIYRRFAEIAEYSSAFRGITKMVTKDNESAGRVTSTYISSAWLNVGFADSFCQFAGYFANSLAVRSANDIYICSQIDGWMRSPGSNEADRHLSEYEVFALHHKHGEEKYISDIFVFNPENGDLVEIINGVHYQKVSKTGFVRMLERHQTASQNTAFQSTELPPPATHSSNCGYPTPCQTPPAASNNAEAEKGSCPPNDDVSKRMRFIISDLAGVPPGDIQDSSDLAELGIDSLLGMELSREIEGAFSIHLETEKLSQVTDFAGLLKCVQTTAGVPWGEDVAGSTLTGGQAKPLTISPGSGHLTQGAAKDCIMACDTIMSAFDECKSRTDKFITDYKMGKYCKVTLPEQTRLCVVHILDAFESLGCNMRQAAEGQTLPRIDHLTKHNRFVDWMYTLLEVDAGLICQAGSSYVRTGTPVPQQTAKDLWQNLIRNSPDHIHDHNLTYHVGSKLADCLLGKADGIQLIFGSRQGREIISNMYGSSPINVAWVRQMESFLSTLMTRVNIDAKKFEPIRILEMGAGTGGTTARMLPLLARSGVPVRYTVTDISPSLVASARKRFKEYDFVDYKVLDIEKDAAPELLASQHIVLATNCVHATRNLKASLGNIRKMLRHKGFLMMLEMTAIIPWVELAFGSVEGWWLFNDGREHALASPMMWNQALRDAGYGYIDWTEGSLPESEIQRIIIAAGDEDTKR